MRSDDWPAVVGIYSAGIAGGNCAYAGVADNSVYVHSDHHGRGVGRMLLTALLDSAGAAGYWTIQTGIFPENTASVAFHQACGFRIVGTRQRLGKLNGMWRDVLLLEHRRPD